MSSVKWTEQQSAAIHTRGCNVLVSAGAGSGKTAVLTERCAHLIADADPPCPVDRLLVVTFTEAAAAEMRERIAAALEKRIAASPNDTWLRRQRLLLDSASISTIHAFCRRTLERFFTHASIEPKAPLIAEPEGSILRHQIAQEVLDAFTTRTDETGDAFLDFLAAYAPGSTEPLLKALQSIDHFLTSIPDPSAWVRDALDSLELTPSGGMPKVWFSAWRDALVEELTGQKDIVEQQIGAIRASSSLAHPFADILQEYANALEDWLGQIEKKPTAETIDRICVEGIPSFDLRRSPARGAKIKSLPQEELQAFDNAQAALKDTREKLLTGRLQKNFGHCAIPHWTDTIRRTAPHIRMILTLITAIRDRYEAAKRELGVVDFADLERKMLDLLSDESNGIADRLRDQYDHILVDEFQDVNRLQARIIELISRQCRTDQSDNTFAVGDIKQSIYRFRLAEPTLFIERQKGHRQSAQGQVETDLPPGTPIDLVENFRSRPLLLDAINTIFEHLMTEDFGGVDYDEHARLRAGRKEEASEGSSQAPPIELHILADTAETSGSDDSSEQDDSGSSDDIDDAAVDWERIEREAYVISQRIHALNAEGIPYRDMVILLRSMQAHAAQLMRVLIRCGIPVTSPAPGDFFDATEIRDMLSLLRVLDNEQQDIPLAAVLRSPLLGDPLTEAEFVEIRADDRPSSLRLPFHETVRRYASEGSDVSLRTRLARHLKQLQLWRQRLRRRSLPDVLSEIYAESGYAAYVLGRPEGDIRAANLQQLHQHARQFASFEQQGLHRFLAFLDDMQEADQSLKEGTPPPLDDNAVQIMTIHSSKGLEFPVVFIAELGKKFNLTDAHGTILLDRTRGLALPVIDIQQRIRYPSMPYRLIGDAIKKEALAEDMRVLYVAMTRARERLILVGTARLDKLDAKRSKYAGHVGPTPVFQRRTAAGMLDWIIEAVCCQSHTVARWPGDECKDAEPALIEIATYKASEYDTWTIFPPERAETIERLSECARFAPIQDDSITNPDTSAALKIVQRRLMTPYAYAQLTHIPAVASASVMKNRWLQAEAGEEGPSAPWMPQNAAAPAVRSTRLHTPAFIGSTGTVAPTDRGTYTHEMLERLDLSRACDAEDLRDQRDALLAAGVFTAKQASSIDIEGLVWFFQTELGERIRRFQTCVHREWPFVLGVDPGRYDPAASSEDPQDTMLVRGVIDVLFDAGEGWEILDYKTDNVSGETLAARSQAYRGQLDIYAEAVRALWQVEATKKWLVFLTARHIVCHT